jgi:hypothetical protein
MAGNPNEGALSPKQLQVNQYYRIRRSDEENGGKKLILFQYMGSDTHPFPLKFRYMTQPEQIVRYKESDQPVGDFSNAVIREGATGPTFIYPVDETLRNVALRHMPPTFYEPGLNSELLDSGPFADKKTHDLAKRVVGQVKEEAKRYRQLTGEEIYEQNYGPFGGRKSRKRKTRKSKKRARKTRRRY